MKVHNLVVTGSLTSGGENISTISSSVATTVTALSSSLTSSIGSLSSSMVTMVDTMSSSMSSRFDTVQSTTSSLNSFTSSATGRLNSVEGKTGSYATTGSNTFVGLQTIQGSIVPAAHATYDLGSAGYNFRHLYLSSASLYIDGTKVLGSTTQELQITTDNGQSFKILEAGSDTITLQSADGNITLATSGGGDVILDPTSGIIALKGTTTIYAGNKVLSSDGNPIHFGNSVTMTGSLIVTGYIETQELRTTYISSSILYRSGSTKFGDELTDTHAFSGSVLISGSLSVPGSGLISGSSQILNGSGVVSGSAQVDVMSTTNIARLATTGSNIFTSNQVVTGSISSTGNIKSEGVLQWNNGIGALSYGGGSVTMETNTAAPILLKTNGTTAITIATGQTVTFANDILTGVDKGIKFDSSGASGHPEISVDSGVNLNFKNSAGLTNLRLKNNGELIVSGSINIANGSVTNTFNINQPGSSTTEFHLGHFSNGTYISNNYYYAGGHLYTDNTLGSSTILLDTNGIYLRASAPNAVPGNHMFISGSGQIGIGRIDQTKKLDIYDANPNGTDDVVRVYQNVTSNHAWYRSQRNGGANMLIGATRDNVDGNIPSNVSILWNVSNHDIAIGANNTEDIRILASSGNVGINDTNPSRKLAVNFGTSVNDGLIVYGSQRQNTVFRSTGEHCFLYIDSHHANTFLPKLHLQRSSTTYGLFGLERASNSDSIGAYTESEVIVGSTTTVPFSLQTNNIRRINVESGGNVNVYNALSVSGNLGARNFVKYVKSWSSNGSYTWHTELASIASAFDSACWYKGFIRESNGAHYNGYQFDIHVGQIGYGGTANQFVVRNMTFAGGPWTGGCGSSSFAAIDNSGFTKQSSGCFDSLEMFITRIG